MGLDKYLRLLSWENAFDITKIPVNCILSITVRSFLPVFPSLERIRNRH